MSLLNYTTSVPVSRTMSQIQGILVAHGARAIRIDYNDNREPVSLSFMVNAPSGELPFRLPANIDAVDNIMTRERLPGHTKDGQPARVAWRIIKDWVEAQTAIIEAEMVTMEEVFLPYLIGDSDLTLYEIMKGKGFLLGTGEGGKGE